MTADLTYKTDFGQVEADQEVVNVSRFSLFFPEKRQFFTEAATIFDYGQSAGLVGGDNPLLQVYYSRRVGLDAQGRAIPLLGGGRVTGRVGDYQIGLLNIQTESRRFALGCRRRGRVGADGELLGRTGEEEHPRPVVHRRIFTNREDGDGARKLQSRGRSRPWPAVRTEPGR